MKHPRRRFLHLAAGAAALPATLRLTLGGSPSEFGKFIAEETEKWGKVVKLAGLKPE